MEDELDFTTPIVNALQNEHNELFARTRSIDTRASILITILLAVLPFYFEILDWTYLKECFVSQCLSFKDFCMICFFCGTIITLLVSLLICVVVLSGRKYHIFPAGNYQGFDLNTYKELDVTLNQINVSIIASYTDCIEQNNIIVENKAKKYIIAIITTSLHIAFVITSVLLNLL